jgi:tagatose-6-phosphate ketose/aldose isomerase
MKYLGIESEELKRLGAIHTAVEIAQQPQLWKKIYEKLCIEQEAIQSFFGEIKDFSRIILTGAGTSAFIGLSLRGIFQRRSGVLTEAISTTDLVSHPNNYFRPEVPTLLISFARSGDSPESVASVTLADQLCNTCYHLIITCNPKGQLANHPSRHKKYVFNLPDEANDQSLAMTSSYSGMLLAGKLIAHIDDLEKTKRSVEAISAYAERAITHFSDAIKDIAQLDFKRAVFLGSGPFLGTATEAHLKLQELTDGKVICKNDSFLGFRHGPKTVIDKTTLVAYIFSNNHYSNKYEKDLIDSMKKGNPPLVQIGVSESLPADSHVDYAFAFTESNFSVDEEFLAIASIVPFQILGFFKSLHVGLKPDAPSESGAISRVVEGVQIYAMQ